MLGDDWVKLCSDKLYEVFDQWLYEITGMDYWSEENPEGQRIYWKSFQTTFCLFTLNALSDSFFQRRDEQD